ncbi:hypothetical protein [Mangrovibacterium marinum]|uniref:Uncharacterized protein n=1 Tax=Mangrovibacterium marinum TaxID=1639118 RepID=A0A2T5C1N7_9BACT|nr:hypothetical protein [Mangrovibacterium marinum]PTN08576.1 hypothetical protein C8N47_108133 [Mangrovibacterium marinum]
MNVFCLHRSAVLVEGAESARMLWVNRFLPTLMTGSYSHPLGLRMAGWEDLLMAWASKKELFFSCSWRGQAKKSCFFRAHGVGKQKRVVFSVLMTWASKKGLFFSCSWRGQAKKSCFFRAHGVGKQKRVVFFVLMAWASKKDLLFSCSWRGQAILARHFCAHVVFGIEIQPTLGHQQLLPETTNRTIESSYIIQKVSFNFFCWAKDRKKINSIPRESRSGMKVKGIGLSWLSRVVGLS